MTSSPRFLYALALVPIIAVLLFAILRPVKVLPRIRLAPGYALIDQNGARVSSEEMRGQITLYSVTGIACGGACAEADDRMAQVAARLTPAQEVPVALVTIAVDAANRPELLQSYAQSQQTEPSRRLLTGEASQIKLVVGGGFNTFFEADDPSDAATDRAVEGATGFYLEPSLALVDGLGVLRAEYRGRLPPADSILRDIALLAQEARNSTGLTRYAYEAAHLFLCYP